MSILDNMATSSVAAVTAAKNKATELAGFFDMKFVAVGFLVIALVISIWAVVDLADNMGQRQAALKSANGSVRDYARFYRNMTKVQMADEHERQDSFLFLVAVASLLGSIALFSNIRAAGSTSRPTR